MAAHKKKNQLKTTLIVLLVLTQLAGPGSVYAGSRRSANTLPEDQPAHSLVKSQATETREEPAVKLTAAQKAKLAYKNSLLETINEEREAEGLPALLQHTKLEEAADIRALEGARYFSHTRPDGSRCFTVLDDLALPYQRAGENLAAGFKNGKAAVVAWMASPGHRDNILNEAFTHMAAGYYRNAKGKVTLALLFYTPQEDL